MLHVEHRFFGYQATNKCCRDWLLLGWPADANGEPEGRDVSRDPVFGSVCPKCKGMIYFNLARPDIECDRRQWLDLLARFGLKAERGATLVGGRLRAA